MMLRTFHELSCHSCIFFSEVSKSLLVFKLGYCLVLRVLYILDISPLLNMWFANISITCVACLFILLKVFLAKKMSLNFFLLSKIFFRFFGIISKNSLPYPSSWVYSHMFPSKNLIVLCFTFKVMIHFELIIVWGVRFRSRFFFFFA